ncbi:MAG: helix-turn-helix transcriptional regulator [Arhodomonas sp.]|nr:helix-turn-helix transcriptional regulator [Arhodomonas sp.]
MPVVRQVNAGAAMEYLTTAEVAAYLRMKERKVYALVRDGQIPCSRVTGKLLFPRQAVDLWVMGHLRGDRALERPAPPVYAGSHDPLLGWALREAGSGLAELCNGSGDGVRRLLDGDAQAVGLHVIDAETAGFNDPVRLGLGGLRDLVMIRWASRRQGLVVAPGTPQEINALADLAGSGCRLAMRQPAAGADTLFRYLLGQAGIDPQGLAVATEVALTEDDAQSSANPGRAGGLPVSPLEAAGPPPRPRIQSP